MLNLRTPLLADDFCRAAHSYQVTEIIKGIIDSYLSWSGRFFVIFLTESFLSNSYWLYAFNIINALAFPLLVFAIYFYAFNKMPSRRGELFYLGIITILIWGKIPNLSESIIWKTGSIQYSWAILMNLIFFYPYYSLWSGRQDNEANTKNCFFKIGFPLYAFLVAGCLENISLSFSVGIAIILVKLYKKKRLPLWAVVSYLSYLLGTIILFAAPGNYVRKQAIMSEAHYPMVIERILPYGHYFLSQFKVFILIFLGVWILRRLAFKLPIAKNTLLLLAIFVVSAISLIGVPNIIGYDDRIFFVNYILALMIIMSLLPPEQAILNKVGRPLCYLLLFSMLVYFSYSFIQVFKFESTINLQYQQREKIIGNMPNKATTVLGLKPYYYNSSLNTAQNKLIDEYQYYADDIKIDPQDWHNICMRSYYGLKEVYLISSS